MKINSVTLLMPEDTTELTERYTNAVAQVLIQMVPAQHLDLLVEKLREVNPGEG